MKNKTAFILLFLCCALQLMGQRTDLTAHWDTTRVLINPDKGWYHHYMDNSIEKYKLSSDAELDTFPSMHHLFVRIPWAYLEPEEGQYHWETIDTIVARYAPKGYKLSLDITCKETMGKKFPYATPQWVEQAGAKGGMVECWGSEDWEPDYNDPVFLEKLNNFHRAMAARYDGKEWLQDVTTGSIGDWGEGASRRITAEIVIKHLNILLNNYKRTQIVIGDDYLGACHSQVATLAIRKYVQDHKVSYRDDSVFWEGVVQHPGSIQNVSFFEDVWRDSPTTLELCHYSYYKDRYWSVPDGREKGLDLVKDAIRISHATFISPHGYLGEWQKENPKATWELINMTGYWFFPQWMVASLSNGKLYMDMAWVNKGVAPAYKPYLLKVTLTDTKGMVKELPSVAAGNDKWLPGSTLKSYVFDANQIAKGKYIIEILLYKPFDNGHIQPVKLGLTENLETKEGGYKLGMIELK